MFALVQHDTVRQISESTFVVHPDYQWIEGLYPAVFTDEKVIIFLSIDKFVRKNTPIIEGSYYFQKRLIDGSLIFIDEFDATKENVLQSIIKSGLDSRADLLDLFGGIHQAVFGRLRQHDDVVPVVVMFRERFKTFQDRLRT